jgi:F-type H+-transporting ATPase subunit b
VNSLAILLQVAAASAAPRAPEAQLLDVDGTVFVMLGIFLLVLLLLWPLLWRPYLRVRDERVARVDGARGQAEKLDGEAAARLTRIEASLAEARREGDTESIRMRHEAQAREQKILAEAQAAARQMMAEARAKLETTVAAERAALEAQTASLAREIAEKALGRSLAS